MTLLFILVPLAVYLAGAVSTWRRLAYAWNAKRLSGHAHQNVCEVCRCVECGVSARQKTFSISYRPECCKKKKYVGMHTEPVFWSAVLSLFGWPLIAGVYAVYATHVKLGHNRPFFVPPPAVEPRARRRERRIAALEQECGIGNGRSV